MKHPVLLTLSAIIFVCMACGFVSANTTQDRFRCPNGTLVSVNERLTSVMMRCDPPTMSTKRMVTVESFDAPVTIEVEEWVYNMGSTSFMYFLIFNNGILKRIESGAYGN